MKAQPERTCIVTRQAAAPDDLIRFVVAPDGTLVPDLKRNLPGRGCWVGADRTLVERAVARKAFAKALKRELAVPPGLPDQVDALLVKSALGALGLARKAGVLALGAAKVESAVRSGKALAVLHAFEAAEDGVRRLAQACRAVRNGGGAEVAAYKLFSEAEMGLALGGTNVIHAAVLAGDPGKAALKRVTALDRYRGGTPADRGNVAASAAEDTE